MSDEFLKRVKNKEINISFCEPLAEFHLNLKFCPNREEGEWLSKELERDPFGAEDLIYNMFCDFCESEDWIIVATNDAVLMALLVEPEFGKKVKEALKAEVTT